MNSDTFLPYAKPYLDDDDRQAAAEVLTTAQLTRGPRVEAFEEAVAEYCGAPHAVAFCNGTAAMQAAYFAAQIGPFDHIITTPLSFIGTITGGLLAGSRVQFADISGSTGTWSQMSTVPIESSRGRPIYVPMHFGGTPVDMSALSALITDPNAVLIEDAAHALGASQQQGDKVGSCRYSDLTAFSFHPIKSITCCEGGMVLTANETLYRRMRQFRNNGIRHLESEPWLYTVEFPSGNFHMSELHAAIGLSQMKKLDQFIAKRRELVAHYRTTLADTPYLTLLSEAMDAHSAHHLMVVKIDYEAVGQTRGEIMAALKARGIGTQVHYIPLYHHPAVKAQTVSADCPNAEAFYAQALSLPLYYDLTKKNVERVSTALKETLRT